MSAAAAKYARLARKAKRLRRFMRTCMARYAKERVLYYESRSIGDNPGFDFHQGKMQQIYEDFRALYYMIRDIKDEMDRLAGRERRIDLGGPRPWRPWA